MMRNVGASLAYITSTMILGAYILSLELTEP